jgi:DNA-binding Lrp family transcriptional regulator
MNATKTNYGPDPNELCVNKEYFGTGLKCLDMFIISTIEEYENCGKKCQLANKTLSSMFHRSESTIKRSIDKLEKLSIIKRNTFFVSDNGQSSKKRILTLKPKNQWQINWHSNGGEV